MLAAAGLVYGCGPGTGEPSLVWTQIDSLDAILPEGIEVYEGSDLAWPLRAWYVRASLSAEHIEARVLHSDDSDGRETISSFAYDEGACVVLNGGYFRMDLSPSRPIGLLMVDSAIVQRPTPSVLRNELSYPVARATVGFDREGRADIGRADRGARWSERDI